MAAPVANFTADVTSGAPPLTVQFTDTSTNTPTSWAWDFGDGGTSTDQNPEYVYADPGVYDVALTATNGDGADTETKTGFITGLSDIAAPTIRVMQNGYGMVYLYWKAVDGAVAYRVYEGGDTEPTTLKATISDALADDSWGYIFTGTSTEFVRVRSVSDVSEGVAYSNEGRVPIDIGRLPSVGSSQALQHIKGT